MTRTDATYAILQPRGGGRLLAEKLATLADQNLDFLVVVNPGCQQLRSRVVYLAGLVALAQAGNP